MPDNDGAFNANSKDDDADANDADANARDDHAKESVVLVYEPNRKHKDPWQPGRKGSICEAEVHSLAQELLDRSTLWENGKRYSVYAGKAYCAQQHSSGRWHGYPVGWQEVPAKLALRMRRDQLVSKREQDRYWETH